jgi:ADP-ribose pyrophosphatase
VERHPDVRVESSEQLYRGRVFALLHERIVLPSGLRQDLTLIDHPGAVAVVPVGTDGRVLLVRQYRHATGSWLWEIPAGRLEPGEAPLAAARRELEEETGLRAAEWSSLGGFFAAPGFCSEWMHLFAACGLAPAGPSRAPHDADEELEVAWLPFTEALELTSQDAKSAIALRRWLDASGAR